MAEWCVPSQFCTNYAHAIRIQFVKENFLDAAEQILNFKAHRDAYVRKMVVTLIPTLAVYDTQTFAEHHLHKSMAHLLAQLDKPAERSVGKHTPPCLLQSSSDVAHSVHRYRSRRERCGERDEAVFRLNHAPDQARPAGARVRHCAIIFR